MVVFGLLFPDFSQGVAILFPKRCRFPRGAAAVAVHRRRAPVWRAAGRDRRRMRGADGARFSEVGLTWRGSCRDKSGRQLWATHGEYPELSIAAGREAQDAFRVAVRSGGALPERKRRPKEAATACWEHVDLTRAVWTIPHTKNRQPHVVHSDLVRPISWFFLRSVRARWPAIGTAKARRSPRPQAFGSLFHRHDLRRSGSTVLGDIGELPHVIKAQLNH
jgi:hypothetical protein